MGRPERSDDRDPYGGHGLTGYVDQMSAAQRVLQEYTSKWSGAWIWIGMIMTHAGARTFP